MIHKPVDDVSDWLVVMVGLRFVAFGSDVFFLVCFAFLELAGFGEWDTCYCDGRSYGRTWVVLIFVH